MKVVVCPANTIDSQSIKFSSLSLIRNDPDKSAFTIDSRLRGLGDQAPPGFKSNKTFQHVQCLTELKCTQCTPSYLINRQKFSCVHMLA